MFNGAPLFLENNEKFTPCDLAMRAGYDDIAAFLESRMVFVSTKLYHTSTISKKLNFSFLPKFVTEIVISFCMKF